MAKNKNFEKYGETFITKSGKVRKKRNSIPDTDESLDIIRRLARIHCTIYEVAAFFEVDSITVGKFVKRKTGMEFNDFVKMNELQGKISLKRTLWQKAVEQNDIKAMIFLAKNYLGMSDKVEVRGEDGNYQFVLAYRLKDPPKEESVTKENQEELGDE